MKTKLTFIQFIALSPEQLDEATKKLPKPKKRPKMNLWFMDQALWKNDLNWSYGKNYLLHTSEEEEEASDVYATDPSTEFCYGVWRHKQGQGITFHKVRPLNNVKNPRVRIKQLQDNA